MSAYRKNILVGVTVLGALAMLGWMILKFGDRPAKLFTTPGFTIHFIANRADGLSEGSQVNYLGVNVGRIGNVRRSDDGMQVIIDAEVDRSPPLPANLEGRIRATGPLGAGAAMALTLIGDEPTGKLAAGTTLHARFIGQDIFPPEFASLAAELRLTSEQLRKSNIIQHLDDQVTKAGKVMDSFQNLVDDPKMRENLRQSLENIRTATESANRIGSKLDKLSDDAGATLGQVRTTLAKTETNMDTLTKTANDRMLQVAKLLENIQSITAKIDKGEGTAGQFVNDPKLYQGLVDSTKELNATIATLNRLVEQWEQEGVSLKLNK